MLEPGELATYKGLLRGDDAHLVRAFTRALVSVNLSGSEYRDLNTCRQSELDLALHAALALPLQPPLLAARFAPAVALLVRRRLAGAVGFDQPPCAPLRNTPRRVRVTLLPSTARGQSAVAPPLALFHCVDCECNRLGPLGPPSLLCIVSRRVRICRRHEEVARVTLCESFPRVPPAAQTSPHSLS